MTEQRIGCFWSKVDTTSDPTCWLWVGARTQIGYGNFWDGRRSCRAHRFSFGVDIDAVVADKMTYNASRPFKHNKAY